MLKNVFLAAAILIASPAFVSAQDIFWSLSPTELVTTSTSAEAGETGSVYIFSDLLYEFDAIDLNFTVSGSCARFTGAEFNPELFNNTDFPLNISAVIEAEGDSGNLFLVSVIGPPLFRCPFNATFFCVPELLPGVEPNVGPNGAVMLARVDFEILGGGDNIDFEFALGSLGAILLPDQALNPSFGSATVELESIPGVLLGDVNLDGIVNFFDILPFISVLSADEFQLEADLNQDCEVNFFDIPFFITFLG